jgi:hypothetical protein
MEGCGTSDFALYNNDGSYNSPAHSTSYSKTCDPNYYDKIQQDWSFHN